MVRIIIAKSSYCCIFQQHLCKLPEDNFSAETCRSKLIFKYTIHRMVHLLVQIKFVILFTMHGMNDVNVVKKKEFENLAMKYLNLEVIK